MTLAPAAPARRSFRAIAIGLVAFVALTALDLGTKAWAEQDLARERTGYFPPVCAPEPDGRWYFQRVRTRSIVLVDDYLEFRYAENCGAAFGMLDKAPAWLRAGVFVTAALVAIVALGWMFVNGSGGAMFAWSVPLILSGAVGNMVDRVRLGYVVDFIRFHVYDKFEYPTFNVADATITIGVVLLLLDGMRRPSKPSAPDDTNAPSE